MNGLLFRFRRVEKIARFSAKRKCHGNVTARREVLPVVM
jgi:hypothetical protein